MEQLTQISTSDIMSIAKSFAESGMFPDIKSAAQAAVKIQAGKEFGIQPFAAMNGIHIIQGKATIGAGLIAARVKGFGKYDYKVVEHTELKCSIEFFTKANKESLGVSTFTIDDAKKAGTKNLDKFPKNMLFARAMSNGVKWYTPDIYDTPVYVPEEMEHLTNEVETKVVDITDELKSAISRLESATTLDELKEVKSSLPEYIVKTEEFQSKGKIKFNELNKLPE